MTQLLATLAGIHPLLPWSLLTLAIWFGVYAIRKWAPLLWTVPTLVWARDWAIARWPESDDAILDLWKVVQALPAILTGALVGAWQMGSDPAAAWKGAAAGALAPAIHYLMRALPWLPYIGKLGRPSVPKTGLLVLAGFVVWSCATWKPAAKTANELARDMCALFFSEAQGISFEDAAEMACDTHEKVKPFLDELLAAKQAAGAKAGAGK
jgi:hypothetical protein